MQSFGFYVSGYAVLYLFMVVIGMGIIHACDRLPLCVAPSLLSPRSVGNELLLAFAFFLMYFGFFGLAALMFPTVDADLSVVYASCAGILSLAAGRE